MTSEKKVAKSLLKKKDEPGTLTKIWYTFVEHYFGCFFCTKGMLYLLILIPLISVGAIALNNALDKLENKPFLGSNKSLFKKAEQFFTENNFRKAIKIYSEILETEPNNAICLNNRGLSYFQIEMLPEAANDFDKAIQIEPFNPTFYFNRANYYVKKDDKVKAEFDFDKALEINPEFYSALINRGNMLVNLGRSKEARDDFQRVIESKTDDKNVLVDAYFNRGNLNTLENNYEEAYADFSYCIKEMPDEHIFYLSRGSVSHRNRTYDFAIEDFNMSLDKQNGQQIDKILNARGMSYMHSNRTDEARKDFERSIKYRGNPESFFAMGLLEKKLGNYNESLTAFSNAIFIDKGMFDAYFNKGLIFIIETIRKYLLHFEIL
jgi:tetratricopeptide (TPR) repeat protein